jgi:hypothetical protein
MALLGRSVRRAVLGVAGVILIAPAVEGQRAQVSEWDVKAAYLYKFTEYVEWPAAALDGEATFTICVVADRAFTRLVDQAIQGGKVKDKPVVRRQPETAAAARQCQVLFIGRDELARSDWFVEALEHSPVLLVSDAPDFLARGGTIALVLEGTRVRFEISLLAARRAGLTVSSRLLRSARRVIENGVPR